MELLTHRYRSLTVLVVVILVQLLLLGYQVRSQQEVRLVRVWAVTAVTPIARILESLRSGASSVVGRYIRLVGVEEENQRLKAELGELKNEAHYLRRELATAERAEALSIFHQRNPSRTVAARVIGAGTGAGSKVVFIDRGSGDSVVQGMAVITPDGIVGRVSAVFPTASQVVLITDPGFAAGVVSQKHHVQGTLKGQGRNVCVVDYVQNDEVVEVGEWFYTSGDDRVFPRGLPVGKVRTVRAGQLLKEIEVISSGLSRGLEEVLVVIEGVHQPVLAEPELERVDPLPLPPSEFAADGGGEVTSAGRAAPRPETDADRLLEHYRRVGEAQGHRFGVNRLGVPPPDFNIDPERPPPPPADPAQAEAQPAPSDVTDGSSTNPRR